jgi:hypothetical protein
MAEAQKESGRTFLSYYSGSSSEVVSYVTAHGYQSVSPYTGI